MSAVQALLERPMRGALQVFFGSVANVSAGCGCGCGAAEHQVARDARRFPYRVLESVDFRIEPRDPFAQTSVLIRQSLQIRLRFHFKVIRDHHRHLKRSKLNEIPDR